MFDIEVLPVLTELTDNMLQTGREGLSHSWISPGHLQSLPDNGMYWGSHSMECSIKPQATMVIWYITKPVGATGRHHAEHYVPERMHTDSQCIKKQLPARNKVTLALDEWTSMKKLALI